ncbi:MAG: nitrilase-related carbon-nitrogen hydrolase, partial [Nocardioides sp.]
GLMTCYDLRFPELARSLVTAGAEVLVIPAAWVAGRRKVDHWRTLVRARAIENTVYVVAAAQTAPRYCGHSLVVDPLGDVLAEAGDGPEVLTAVLQREVLEAARRTNPSLANRRL